MNARKPFVPALRVAIEVLICLAGAAVLSAAAVDTARGAEAPAAQPAERELIPGAEQMTAAERDTYRRRMQEAATPQEKEKIRAEYVKAAQIPSPPPGMVGDPARGAQLHRACFGCHGIERYTSPVTFAAASFLDSVLRASGLSDLPPAEPVRFKGRAQSLSALRAGVIRRNEYLSPKMTPQEIEDVVAYLNETYYKFPPQ